MTEGVHRARLPARAGAAGLTLKAFLTRLIWLCLLPPLLLAAYLAMTELREIQAQRDAQAANMAKGLTAAIDQDLEGRIGALQMLAGSPLAADSSRWAELYQGALGFRQHFGGHVVLADLGAQMLFNTRVPFGAPLPKLPRPKTRSAVAIATETGKPGVGDVFDGPIAKAPLVAVAVPVLRKGDLAFILLSTFETRQLQKHLDRLALPAGWSVTLVDSSGSAIAQRTSAGFTPGSDAEGSMHFVSGSAASAWSARVEIPRQASREPLMRAAGLLALALLGAAAASLIGGVAAGRRLSAAVAALARPASPGDRAPGIAEIADVRRYLDEAAAERQNAEADLRRSEQRFRSMFEDSPLPQTLVDEQGLFVGLNKRFVETFGYTLADLRTVGEWVQLAYPDPVERSTHLEVWNANKSRPDAESSPMPAQERQVRCKDGSRRDMLLSSIKIGDYFLSTLFDITERKQAEALHLRLAAIVESSDDAIIGKTLDGIITSWNPGAEKLFGYSEAEAIGRPMLMLIPPQRASEEADILQRIGAGETVDHFETVRVRKDGTLVDVSATISPIRDSQGLVVGASKIARNVTERRQAQSRLQAQLERLSLLDQITTAIGERQDLNSIYQVVVRRLEERLPVDFACILSHEPALESLQVLKVGAASDARAWTLMLGEGQRIEIDPNGLAACLRGELIYEPDTAATAAPFSQRLADAGLRSLVMAPLQSDRGLFGILVLARSGTAAFSSADCEFLRQVGAHVALAARQMQLHEALQAAYDELRQTQQSVMQQERLRALGQMASGVAHDINNAISPVLLYTETLLEHEPGLSPRARGYLQTIARSADDVAATVARLREFYRQREAEVALVRVHLPPLLEQVLALTRARWHDMPLQRGIVVTVAADFPLELPAVMGIESELREALINLVFNAVDAMLEGGELTLRARALPQADAAATVEVEVIDTGIGMDEDTRRRCMEPFFSTKGERGTGLGLAMVYGVMQRHGAELHIDSAPGRGTTMRLSFPVALPGQAAATLLEMAQPSRPLRLLLIDDDFLVLNSLRDTLASEGHEVLTADGGQAGIELFLQQREAGTGFDVVLTDLGMPYVDGRQVARAIKAHSPAMPVILITGWGQRLVAEGEVPPNVDAVLSKPPKLREMRAALARLAG